MKPTNELIAQIVESELKMFLAVPGDGSGNCQQNPDAFKVHRKAQFCLWSEETLSSYLNDLKTAETNSDNLMTKKYAIIQGLIPKTNTSKHLEDILKIQMKWQEEMLNNHPQFKGKTRPLTDDEAATQLVSFKSYAEGELQTYSEKTLELLHADLKQLADDGINGSLKIYTTLVTIASQVDNKQ
ncbi:DUF4125 family protein [Desulforhopalus sp. 52FAK]